MKKLYSFNQSEGKLIDKIINDDILMINHIILNKGEFLPEHCSNSNVYMVVVQGTITLQLGNKSEEEHINGTIVNIPNNIKMNVSNKSDGQLEFFVLKVLNPKLYQD
ncbi:cupin domain-containing protein [Fusobacterium ulcerans]|jgi:quercetin dioxygenase-like cupin family protein|uniref:Cupin 2 conserved barrel domain-containing protein n=1 Tax=Fusobacterium ulcerans 12-1B TaxID=457404 RepID=H1PYS4_9FUSO|nr:cupin domain-containing protein [Fusobacterium ulcerans]EHO77084.1 hypothetical protein HMPREF0402_03567 [Fusobacterium ulcerans 12-1B]